MSSYLDYALPLIKQFEGCRLAAYPDPASGGEPWTIGWGTTGANIVEGLVIDQETANRYRDVRLQLLADGIVHLLGNTPSEDHQIGALVSLGYNIGISALSKSTLIKKFISGDVDGAADEFLKWDHAGGKVLFGLTLRRAAERRVFQTAGVSCQ